MALQPIRLRLALRWPPVDFVWAADLRVRRFYQASSCLPRACLAKSSCFTRKGHRKGACNFSPDLSNSSAETCISKSTHHSISSGCPERVLAKPAVSMQTVHEIVDHNETVLLGRGTWAASAAASAPKPAASHHADLPSPTAYSEPYLLRQTKKTQRATFTRRNR